LAPTIGVYSPIGTESSPIIQFYASLGLAGQARRSLNFFLDKQHEDGFIQNFGGYMIETGAALWSMGEYYRYTQDKEWLAQTAPKILKSCQYLQKWRARNQQETLRGRGYGMIDGKVADPEDPYHQFMLNAYGFLGLSRAAEMLAALAAPDADRWQEEAREWKQDIRVSFEATLARSPVVPLGDGTWCPTAPPWTEADGMRALYLQPERFFSHGTFTVADAMLGPLYLVFGEVYKTSEPAAEMLLKYHSELFYLHNAAFSQPYYSRHNWVQLKRGLVKPFLKTYYHTFSSVADRETYSFWEHLYHVSPHKTHEEAWFLMETRWMLYLEDGPVLNLLPGIPRRWLEDGQRIELKNVASYFGPVSLSVLSRMKTGSIEATVACPGSRKPESVRLRLPHPEGKRATRVTGGMYEPATETIRIEPFTGNATLKVEYN
jgi:hypothetical protein